MTLEQAEKAIELTAKLKDLESYRRTFISVQQSALSYPKRFRLEGSDGCTIRATSHKMSLSTVKAIMVLAEHDLNEQIAAVEAELASL